MSRYISFSSGADISSADRAEQRRILPSAFAAAVPAVLLLALAASVTRAPFDAGSMPPGVLREGMAPGEALPVDEPATDGELVAMARRGQWPAAQTMVVPSAVPASAVLTPLRGRLEMMAPIRGRSPLAGQVSRVSVKVGQRISVNDPVLELSAGPDSRANRAGSRAERRQTAAESAQVQAANEQVKLQSNLRAAQEQFAESQVRVAAAQRRVDAAREVVRRLQRGEDVTAAEAEPEPAPPTRSTPAPAKDPAADPARRKLLAAATVAQTAAKAARHRAVVAEQQAVKMESKASAAAAKLKDARAALATAQAAFDAGTVKASALDQARAAAEDAQVLVPWSASAATNARKAADVAAEAAKSAQVSSETASSAATRALRDVSVFGRDSARDTEASRQGANPTPKPAPRATGDSLSVTDAARLAGAAIEESKTAVAQAKQLKERMDDYARQVKATRSDIDSSSKQLANAQDAVLDQTIAANLSVVRAPASGVVRSVATIAQSVQQNDVIIEIARADQLRVVWTDATDAWRTLREDARLSAVVNTPGGDRTVTVRIDSIKPEGNGARIEAVLDNPAGTDGRAWQPGVEVSAAVPGTAAAPAAPRVASTSVPPEAIVATDNPATPAPEGSRIAVLVPQAGAHMFRIEWRNVAETSRGDGGVRVTGLAPGERIALRPALLPKSAVSLQLVG